MAQPIFDILDKHFDDDAIDYDDLGTTFDSITVTFPLGGFPPSMQGWQTGVSSKT